MTEKKEYIEREALIQRLAVSPLLSQMQASCFLKEGVLDIIQKFPAADAVEVKHGEWNKRGNEKKCSWCEFIYYSNNDDWSFCPNCGAKMDDNREEERNA